MMLRLSIIITLFNIFLLVDAQVILPLEYNPELKAQNNGGFQLKTAQAKNLFTPPLPPNHYFFDDFYYVGKTIYPNQALWQDKSAFINSTFADSLVTLGVATLDAVNEYGDVYAVDESLTPSDTLTSRAIDISGATDNLYFSFFIQGGGKGNIPETNDSITLEFYHKDSLRWEYIWSLKGMESHTFEQYIIQVGDTMKSDSFMFRFFNFTSLKEKTAPGGDESALTNSDMWHLDYIELQTALVEDSVRAIDDASFTEPLDPTHKDYYSIPWEHLQYSNGGRRGEIRRVIATNFPYLNEPIEIDRTAVSYNIYKGSKTLIGDVTEITNSQQPVAFEEYNEIYNSQYEYISNQNYGHFLRTSYLNIDNLNQYVYNDTIILEEKFTDYYAYDDGSAEFGFGFPGNGGNYMQFAQLYTFFYKPNSPNDTLTAVDFYFAKSRNNAYADMEFSVCIWSYEKDESGVYYPAEIIYPEGNVNDWPTYFPDTTLGYNDFMRINLEKDLIVEDTVFIGFIQLGSDFLSLGYDINTSNKSKIRYNDGNGWQTPQSTLQDGTVMIRPVFDHKVFDGIKQVQSHETVKLFPNPASDYINLMFEQYSGNPKDYKMSIVDILGKEVLNSCYSEQIDISQLEAGIYILIVQQRNSKQMFTQKFLKRD